MINPTLLTINLQFKDLGSIFGSLGDLSGKRFKNEGSYDDFQNYLKDSFNASFGVGKDGISKFNSEQIEAKANVLGLNKELKNQALSLASDAALSAKAATGKLTYADAIKDSINNAPALAKALQKQGKLTLEQEDLLGKLKEGSAGYNEQVKKIINANAELGDSIVELPESASKASTAFSGLSNYFKGLLATLKTMLPLIAAVGAAFAAYSAWKWADNKYNLTYDTNLKNVKEHVSNLQNAQKEVENLNAKADQYKQTLQEIASNYNVTLEGTESVDEMIDKIQSADNVQLIQRQISNVYDAMKYMNDAFVDSGQQWSEYYQSDQYKSDYKNFGDQLHSVMNVDDLEDELKSFRDLLNDDAFLDKQGRITEEGLAQVALLQQSIGTAKQKIADYTTGLQKLKESYDNGVISLTEYNDKSKDYREGIQGSIADVKSYQDSLVDLYKNAMSTEVDYLDKIISKRKEALTQQKDMYDYSKKINSQNNNINSLKAQIMALEGVKYLLL